MEGETDFPVRYNSIMMPEALKKGDKIALISPASAVKEEYVYGAMELMEQRGYQPILMDYALNHVDGSFAASKGDRLMDLLSALEDPEIKAIFCNRGGYGCCQLLANFSYGMISSHPKWIIGFSDVSALLAMWYRSGIGSLHGPMAKHLATRPTDDPCTEALFNILENGGRFDYTISPHSFNHLGEAEGIIRGGNMAVLDGLADTPYDILNIQDDRDEVILFFEDISEPIYKVNRMLWRLALSGTLMRVKALIFGQFTEYKPDLNFPTMEDMIKDFLDRAMMPRIPVVFNFPTGHTDLNFPITEGAKVRLEVTETDVKLKTI